MNPNKLESLIQLAFQLGEIHGKFKATREELQIKNGIEPELENKFEKEAGKLLEKLTRFIDSETNKS